MEEHIYNLDQLIRVITDDTMSPRPGYYFIPERKSLFGKTKPEHIVIWNIVSTNKIALEALENTLWLDKSTNTVRNKRRICYRFKDEIAHNNYFDTQQEFDTAVNTLKKNLAEVETISL